MEQSLSTASTSYQKADRNKSAPLLVALVAGLCVPANQAASETSPRLSQARTMQHEHVAHIYYNMATGERIATLIADGIRPADT
ncbi:MAG: hypothetical protein AB8F26_05885, partial [Phycisphaerales bacterium]